MRICHITTTLENGGAEGAMYRLIRGSLSNGKYEHAVICLGGGGKYEPLLKQLGVTIYKLELKKSVLVFRGLLRLYKILKQENPDVVQAWMYHANLIGGVASKAAGIPKIHWGIRMSNLKNGGISFPTRVVNRVSAAMGNLIPNSIVSCAYKATEEHIAYGYPEHRFVTIPNGYDTCLLTYDENGRKQFRQESNISSHVFVFGTVARWHPQKDHETLFLALKQLLRIRQGEWLCLLIGPNMNTDNQELVSVISKHGLSDRIILKDQQTDIPLVMSSLDLHVLSSRDEGFPNVLAEAMACGTPCVTTNVGDASVIVGDTGWVVNAGDHMNMSIAMQQAIAEHVNECQWLDRKNLCVQRIKTEFGIGKMVASFEALWSPNDELGK